MPDLLVSSAILLAALTLLVRGADAFVLGAKQIGSAFGMNNFAIGVLIVGFGTSLPEFASSLAAVFQGNTEIVIANVVGSNITNILLIIGVVTVIGGTVVIQKNLLKTELPVFFIATTHFLVSLWDGVIDRIEAFLLLGTFSAYMWYLFVDARNEDNIVLTQKGARPKLGRSAIVHVVLGLGALFIGAHYSVKMIVDIGTALAIPIGLMSITVLAIGTSLPELTVSIRAALKKEHELAVGNIFGSNAFNALLIIGVPGMIRPLTADSIVLELGIPVLLGASAILFVSGLSGRIMRWEGIMLLIFFCFFIVKLVALV